MMSDTIAAFAGWTFVIVGAAITAVWIATSEPVTRWMDRRAMRRKAQDVHDEPYGM